MERNSAVSRNTTAADTSNCSSVAGGDEYILAICFSSLPQRYGFQIDLSVQSFASVTLADASPVNASIIGDD